MSFHCEILDDFMNDVSILTPEEEERGPVLPVNIS